MKRVEETFYSLFVTAALFLCANILNMKRMMRQLRIK